MLERPRIALQAPCDVITVTCYRHNKPGNRPCNDQGWFLQTGVQQLQNRMTEQQNRMTAQQSRMTEQQNKMTEQQKGVPQLQRGVTTATKTKTGG